MNISKYLIYILAVIATGFSFTSFKSLDETIKPISNSPTDKPTQNEVKPSNSITQEGYSAIYINDENDLIITDTKNQSYILNKGNGESSIVEYVHNDYNKILYTKEDGLYLFDKTQPDNIQKITENIDEYILTEDDKYVIYTTKSDDKNLYYYNMKKNPIKIDNNITSIKDYSNNYLVYTKENNLYLQKLDYESEKIKITDISTHSITLSKDDKKVLYIDENNNLYSYSIFQNKTTKIASDVSTYSTDNTGTKIYYITKDNKDIYFYNSLDISKIAENITSIQDYIAEEEQILYTTCDENEKCTLYFIKGTNSPTKVEPNITDISAGFISKNELFYHYKEDGIDKLKYVKINDKDIKKMSELTSNVSNIAKINGGIIFTSSLNDNSIGSLYSVKNGTMKKIDENIYTPSLKVSNDGNKYYYLKNYKENKQSGDLYASSDETKYVIDTNIQRNFTYVNDKLIYYIKDYSIASYTGTLYKYTGESIQIANNVKSIHRTPNYYKG